MKISVVFPSVMYREGPDGVRRLVEGVEDIGFDELTMFDHVVMGFATETRRAPYYSPTMPIMEEAIRTTDTGCLPRGPSPTASTISDAMF